jgi:PAS domain S-box-containing protein
VPDIIFSLDRKGRFSFVNARMEPFLGYPVSRILETSLKDYVLSEHVPQVEGILRLGPEEIWDEEIGMLDAKGGQKFARIRCKASYDRDGRLAGFEGVMRDRSSRRKLEEELRGSREALVQKIKIIDELYEHILHTGKCKAIAEHTAEVAHELRQPLAIVGGFARRLAKQLTSLGKIDPETQLQYAEIIVTEVERLERILEGLIDFTRRGAVHLQTIDPNLLIEYVLGITEGQRKQKNIRLETQLGAEIGEVLLDPGRFQQLVLNLVSYAVEASPVGAMIELETGASIPSDRAMKSGELQSESYFEVKIRIRNATIPAEELQQIFSPFSQSRGRLGGPGLAIARKIADDHSGSISVKSNGEGTVFTVWLPLYQPMLDRRQSAFAKGMQPDSHTIPV